VRFGECGSRYMKRVAMTVLLGFALACGLSKIGILFFQKEKNGTCHYTIADFK